MPFKHLIQGATTTKSGLSDNYQKEETPAVSQPTETQVTETKKEDTLSDFTTKVELAIVDGQEWVETSPNILFHYNRTGLGNSKYFTFKGVKVCEWGMSEELSNLENVSMSERLHGKDEGVIETGRL